MRSTLPSADLVLDDAARLLRAEGFVARVRPWPSEPGTVQLVTLDHAAPPSRAAIAGWLSQLGEQGVAMVRTGALGPSVRGAYLDAGFVVRQELTLLSHTLGEVRPPSGSRGSARLRRPNPRDLVALALLDRRAFGTTWGFDLAGIVDACQATPAHRLRIGASPSVNPAAYAVSGRSGRSTYLQRLAVDPSVQRAGIGRALVVDSLRWARRHRATSMLVNTHVENIAALTLYRSLGFVDLSYGLAVLERKLT